MVSIDLKKYISVITCPKCSHKQEINITKDVCKPFYTCDNCGNFILAEDTLCIYEEYGDSSCEFIERNSNI